MNNIMRSILAFAALVTDSIGRRLAIGWIFGLTGSLIGLILSFALDTPPGATLVCTFGVMLVLLAVGRRIPGSTARTT